LQEKNIEKDTKAFRQGIKPLDISIKLSDNNFRQIPRRPISHYKYRRIK